MAPEPRRVNVFFYGSFINLNVLAQGDLVPERVETVRLQGFALRIEPLANLIPSATDSVYGILCEATHEELDRLYGQAWVGTYLPEAVVVETGDGGRVPALCYIAPVRKPAPAADDYIDKIAGAAREHGFPASYLERIESFRPGGAGGPAPEPEKESA